MLIPGLYEQVISKALGKELDLDQDNIIETLPIDTAEAAKILSRYLTDITENGFDYVKDGGGDLQSQIDVANKIIRIIAESTGTEEYNSLLIDPRSKQLMSIISRENTLFAIHENAKLPRPETSIAQSSLFTGSIHEPSMYSELKKEIVSANRVDMLVSFIKWSGLRLIIEELTNFVKRGGQLRVITTSYMGATDIKAVEVLRKLINTEVRVSYDSKRTRLHAKSYIFYRETSFTTAYVGSSNLSNAAISSGLEWNVKVTMKDLPETIRKIEATFESYWNSPEFESYGELEKPKLEQALKSETYTGNSFGQFLFDISPYPFQQEILDQLDAERKIRGFYKNLVVAATGTGKTVVSALDYKRFVKENQGKPNRLLFVAHREEILMQSLTCFKAVLRDPNFGDLFVGNYRPEKLDHLFLSIQTFNSREMDANLSQDFYDYIVVDEFHHAAAQTYQRLLSYFNPGILLGLTATPERMDGKDILEYFDNRVAAEIRLPEAIDRKLLSPFQYFGVTDTVDLDDLKWVRGGYDRSELTKIYSINRATADRRANMIIQSILKYVTDINVVKGLGFCVSVEHAKFMSEYFNAHDIPSIYLYAQSSDEIRKTAKQQLTSGSIRFIFVVDLYNEGVDIPEINTTLFLRPTESLTVFLQQLGRGLRLSEDKECLTVLDFIGQANRKYNFENKFASLLSNSTKSTQYEIKNGFMSLPKGCYVLLERKAREYILDNIKQSFGLKSGLISRIASFTDDSGKILSLRNFADYYHLDLKNIFKHGSFSRLCALAGVREDFQETLEEIVTKSLPRLCGIDSRNWISFLRKIFNSAQFDIEQFSDKQIRMLQMFHFTVWPDAVEDYSLDRLNKKIEQLKDSPVLLADILEILEFNFNRIDFIDEPVELGFDCPLDLHCTYTRDQLLVALGFMKPSTIREGVKYLEEKRVDVFFVTLNKSDKDYSPTTLYNDYSINEKLFHWQSQSTTSATSLTGQRYMHHKEKGSKVLLFVRESKTTGGIASPYTFLGLADYLKHEGSRPMSITWMLRRPIPAKFLKKTNKLVVG